MSAGLILPAATPPEAQAELPVCIHELFEAQATRTPDAVAVTWNEENLTYRELNEQANHLAHFLIRAGVKPETPVALYLERSPRMVIAILGVLKAGGAYVPIDLAYPKERLSFMLEDTQAPILITEQSLKGAVPAPASRMVCLDTDRGVIAATPGEDPARSASPENAAYVIYTSGSTGKPKGVLVTHHNVVRLLKSTAHWYGFNSKDVWPLFHSYAFDVSVWELWGALFHGGRLVVVPYLVTRSPADFYNLLAKERVTVLNQTPSAFRQLIWAEANAEVRRDLNLRYVICAGEALELQSLKPWFDRHGDERPLVVNMYGITETTVHSTYRVIRKSDLVSGKGSVIGVPIPDLQIYLVDDELKPVPPGVPGEICVGGAGVARGYLNRPELTSKRFLPDPFSSEPGARLYRSGDLAQINAEGELEYLGRMDHQVKIRGFRVELGEIESALNRHPGIRESVVVAHPGQEGDKRLVAYMVPVQEAPTVTELRQYLGQKVPDYMVPAVFVFLAALPLTTNGKVDRRALPDPDGARPNLAASFMLPRNVREQTLAGIWSQVLEVEAVGVNDNYFDLGGDSIRSIQILSKARENGLYISLEDIFQHPTVAALAEAATSQNAKAIGPLKEPFSLISTADRDKLPPDVDDAYPLSRLQLGMFFYNELDPLSAIYHDVFSYRIQAGFEQKTLEQALSRLVQRHPQLRTSFQLEGFSQPLQLVHHGVRARLTLEDLSRLSPHQQEALVIGWIEKEKRQPFNRAIAPLVRFHAQRLTEKSFQFFISFHHACLDGWSLAAVVTEIFQDYLALMSGVEPTTESPRAYYRDFVALEQQAIASRETRHFWSEKLKGLTAPLLPRWPKSLRAGGHEQARGPELQVSEREVAGLKRLAQSAGVPLKSVLLAAHQRVLAFLYGQNDVITGLISNGRPEEIDGEKIVGLFLNTLPLRQELSGGTWADLVKQSFRAEQELVPHRRFPLSEIQKQCGGHPPFETAFDFVHFHVYKALQGCGDLDLAEGHYFEANNLTTYTTFMLDVTSTRLELHIDYDPNALCREQIELMSKYYLKTLEAMAAQPDGQYETFSPLSAVEKHRILQDWNDTAQEFPGSKVIDQLFDEMAQKAPTAIAIEFGEKKITYGQLQKLADQVAERLGSLRIDRQELVGVCLERSVEMVATLLGILKAGGTYVPLDPAYPKDRLAVMIQDSKLRLIVTQEELRATVPSGSADCITVESLLQQAGDGIPGRTAGVDRAWSRPGSAGRSSRASSDLAYVIYTSGTTGRPKGVQVTHRSVVNLLISVAKTAGITAQDKLLAVTTLSFDIAALEIFLPLITGGSLVLADRETAGDGTLLGDLLARSGATLMQGTPATWRLMIEAGWTGKKDLQVFCGGEALPRELADELLSRTRVLWNFYGPTETTIWSTAWKVTGGGPILIGRPLGNTQAYILDECLRPVPVGTIGELHLGGEGVSRGYLGQPELTAKKFIENPFTTEPGSRLYKTGDLVRYLPHGQIECLGRVDEQLKIRGFRIEPGEIESILRAHRGIADAVVTAREGVAGDKRLVGYVISKNGPPSFSELRESIQAKLPAYMVPSQFVLLKQFPLTPNGKVDRRSLPAPEFTPSSSSPYLAPRNLDEQKLAEIWQEVLMLNQIGIDDNFFELGGDSLSATRAFARTNRSFDVNLTLREMLEHPTVRSLANVVATSKGTAGHRSVAIPRQPRAVQG